MYKEYAFYVTDEQRYAIQELGLSDVDVSFCTSGMVNAVVFNDYDVSCYTFRKDGGVVLEKRDMDSGGWVTSYRDASGAWAEDPDLTEVN